MSTTHTDAITFPAIIAKRDDNVKAGCSAKQALAVALRDLGFSAKDVAASGSATARTEPEDNVWEDVTGERPPLVGGFGNLYTTGMRALGREAEIASTGAGNRRGPKVSDDPAGDTLRAELDRVRHALDTITTPVTEAKAALDNLDADAIVDAEIHRIAEAVKALQAEGKAIKADPATVVDAAKAKLAARVDAAEARAAESETRLREAEAKLVSTLEVLASVAS